MYKLTKESVDAFLSRTNYKKQNMLVSSNGMYLYGHRIAWFDQNNQLWIHHGGYRTRTTRDRLVALPNVHIVQR